MSVVHLVRDSKRRYYIRLVSANGQILAHSEAYYSKWGAKRAARRNFPGKQMKEVAA